MLVKTLLECKVGTVGERLILVFTAGRACCNESCKRNEVYKEHQKGIL